MCGNIGEHKSANKHKYSSNPVSGSKRILKVDNGENERDEFSQCDDQIDGQGRALGGEHKHGAYANVLGECVAEKVEPQDGHREHDEIVRLRVVERVDLRVQVGVEEHECWQAKDVLENCIY